MFLSSGQRRAAVRIAVIMTCLAPFAAHGEDAAAPIFADVPLPPDLKPLKRAYAKAQAREEELAQKAAESGEAPVETFAGALAGVLSGALAGAPASTPAADMAQVAFVPVPVPRPASLDQMATGGAVSALAQMPVQPRVELGTLVTAYAAMPVPRPAWLDGTAEAKEATVTIVPQTKIPAGRSDIHALVSVYAQRHGVPERLAHRVVMRESRYNPQLKGHAHYGLMQISYPTAKQMGYTGEPAGLFDVRTNLAHGMPYLANAYLVAHGNEDRAVALYSRGYYYDAKRQGQLKVLRTAASPPVRAVDVAEAAE